MVNETVSDASELRAMRAGIVADLKVSLIGVFLMPNAEPLPTVSGG